MWHHTVKDPRLRSKPEHRALPPNYAFVVKPSAPKRAASRATSNQLPQQWDWRTTSDPLTGLSLIQPPQDQQQCGSCYVFSSTECLRNRLAIAGQNAVLPNPSQQSAMDCSINGDTLLGCSQGGVPEAMLQWLSENWIPSDVPPYQYVGADSKCRGVPAPSGGGFRGDGAYTISDSQPSSASDSVITTMKEDILVYGPVVAAYTVYDDFMDYWQSGSPQDVYSWDGHSGVDGGHAVLLIGWGQHRGQPYWLVMNSWGGGGPSGDGTFKIAVATSGTGLESNVTAVWVSNAVDVYARNQWAWQSTSPPPGIPQLQQAGWQVAWFLLGLLLLAVVLLLVLRRA
jgi:hypothetical protein